MAKKRTSKKTTTRKQSKVTPRKKPTVKDKLNASAQPDDACYRVFQIDEMLREQVREIRQAKGWIQKEIILEAVKAELPKLVENLHTLGLAHESSTRRASRWHVDERVLSALRLASQQTTVSMQDLLIACLRTFCKS